MKKLLLSGLLTGFLSVFALPALAQDIAEQPCDPQYWRQMSARAWMEAEREIMQNQNLIFKPDSVLEYVCFDQFLGINANQGGDIFVHTKYFGQQIISRSQDESMNKALENVVYTALNSYKSGNFGHTFLGGRSGAMSSDTTQSQFVAPNESNKSYTCKTMSDIWKAAKCANFVDNSSVETTDGFYPFKAIKKHKSGTDVAGYEDSIQEVRRFPASLSCASGAGGPRGQGAANLGPSGGWKDQIELAENRNLYKFREPVGLIYKDVGEKLEPGNCSGGSKHAIKTGVMVIVDNKESHEDGVCTNPGCSYTKNGTCVQNTSDAGSAGGG